MKQIIKFLEEKPFISRNKIENHLAMPQASLRKFIKGEREIPNKWVYPLILTLIPYGLQLDGFVWSIDPETNFIFGKKFLEEIETQEEQVDGGTSISYIVREARTMASDLEDLI
jgi:hypothetical protein